MKEINDKELDMLINNVFERQELLEEINQQIMKTVKKQHRKSMAYHRLRILAACFGIPLVTVFLLLTYYKVAQSIPDSIPLTFSIIAASVSLIVVAFKSFDLLNEKV